MTNNVHMIRIGMVIFPQKFQWTPWPYRFSWDPPIINSSTYRHMLSSCGISSFYIFSSFIPPLNFSSSIFFFPQPQIKRGRIGTINFIYFFSYLFILYFFHSLILFYSFTLYIFICIIPKSFFITLMFDADSVMGQQATPMICMCLIVQYKIYILLIFLKTLVVTNSFWFFDETKWCICETAVLYKMAITKRGLFHTHKYIYIFFTSYIFTDKRGIYYYTIILVYI